MRGISNLGHGHEQDGSSTFSPKRAGLGNKAKTTKTFRQGCPGWFQHHQYPASDSSTRWPERLPLGAMPGSGGIGDLGRPFDPIMAVLFHLIRRELICTFEWGIVCPRIARVSSSWRVPVANRPLPGDHRPTSPSERASFHRKLNQIKHFRGSAPKCSVSNLEFSEGVLRRVHPFDRYDSHESRWRRVHLF
jgi:hypothetical protein